MNSGFSADKAAQESEGDLALRLRNISKRFGAVLANDEISIELRRGEVLALLGENGAGKTTLMNILFGHYVPDSGTIEVFGHALPPGSPHAAIGAGIGMVHQHFTLGDNLTVLDNVLLGTRPLASFSLRRREGRRRLLEVSKQTGLEVDQDSLVANLTVGQQQRVEILKALYRGARILILDEPTAVLSPQETEQLFATVRDLVSLGMSVIFISHKLKEVTRVADRVAVLRAGRCVFDAPVSQTSREELAHKMVGREVPVAREVRTRPGKEVLALADVHYYGSSSARNALHGANLTVRQHEIVGVAGIAGNGQEVLFDVVSGLKAPKTGTVWINGKQLEAAKPANVIAQDVARIPEDRHATGLIVDLSLWENLISEHYRESRFQRNGWLRRKEAVRCAEHIVSEFDVRCPSVTSTTRLLSGGNMQKLILGRSLSHDPILVIASQPTRGLDVGAVSFIHERLLKQKQKGAAILLISEDLDELLTLSDRIVVMFRGRLSTPIRREDASTERLGLMMVGQIEEPSHAL